MFLQTQVMIYAIREINQRTPRLLHNFTIGYDIYDTCGDVSLAILATLQLLKNQSDPQRCLVPANFQAALSEPQTKAVIGERYSEVSIAVARVVALSSVAQVCLFCTWYCPISYSSKCKQFWMPLLSLSKIMRLWCVHHCCILSNFNLIIPVCYRLVMDQLVSCSAGSWSSPLFWEQYLVTNIRHWPLLSWWCSLTGKVWPL